MASKALASIAILLSLNLIFVTLVSSSKVPCSPTPSGNNHNYQPKPSTSPEKCPKDNLKLGVCANVLKALQVKIGEPPKTPCCSLIKDLVDQEAAACLCTALKANVLGIVNLDIPISLNLLLNYCGKKVPSGFQCA